MPLGRFIKAEILIHEGLYQLEADTKLPVFQAFIGLIVKAADCRGRFKISPALKVQIIPFHPCDLSVVITALERAEFIVRYEVNGESYGFIPSWSKHQKPEAGESPKWPEPPRTKLLPTKSMRTASMEEGDDVDAIIVPDGLQRVSLGLDLGMDEDLGDGGKKRKSQTVNIAAIEARDKEILRLVNEWNDMCLRVNGSISKIIRLTDKRKASFVSRLADKKEQFVELWPECLAHLEANKFYQGQGKDKWTVGIDYVLRKGMAIQLAERHRAYLKNKRLGPTTKHGDDAFRQQSEDMFRSDIHDREPPPKPLDDFDDDDFPIQL